MTGNFYPHNSFKVGVARLIHRMMGGWSIEGEMPKDVDKFIVIAAHHTSNWDFVVGVAAKLIMRLRARFFAKHSLFVGPLGMIMRAFGGIPIERRQSGNRVQQAIDEINNSDHFVLVIAPEGTRSRVERWKTGFYHIAVGADIPVVPVGFDFANKKIVVGKPMVMVGDITTDFEAMHKFFVPYKAKHPELACNAPAENPEVYLK